MRRGEHRSDLSASKSPSSDVRGGSGKVPTTIPSSTPSGRVLLAASLRELERASYLSRLEMEYLSIYRQILPTTCWDLEQETSCWN